MKRVIPKSRFVTPLLSMVLISGMIMRFTPGQDIKNAWIFTALSAVIAIPYAIIIGKACEKCPAGSFYQGIEKSAGRFCACAISVLVIVSLSAPAAGLLHAFCEMVQLETSLRSSVLMVAVIVLLSAYCLCLRGVGVASRWSHFVMPLVLILLAVGFVFSYNDCDFQNLLPIMHEKWRELPRQLSFKRVTVSFSLLMTALIPLCSCPDKKRSVSAILKALAIGGSVLSLSLMQFVLLLGEEPASVAYFKALDTYSIISITSTFSRIEIIILVLLLITLIGYIAIIISCVGESFEYLLPKKKPAPLTLAIPVVIIFVLSAVDSNSTMQLFKKRDETNYIFAAIQLFVTAFSFAAFCIYQKKHPAQKPEQTEAAGL